MYKPNQKGAEVAAGGTTTGTGVLKPVVINSLNADLNGARNILTKYIAQLVTSGTSFVWRIAVSDLSSQDLQGL